MQVFVLLFLLGYAATHLYGLTALPIFADEAIYIRWSQLIIDDWQQYVFFPLNDGKTPLLMWLQVPFLLVIRDQLLAARLLSVLVGLLQAGVLFAFTRRIGGGRIAAALSAVQVAILPYWYFHHRMALIDGLLTLLVSVVVWLTWEAFIRVYIVTPSSLSWHQLKKLSKDKLFLFTTLAAGLSFAAALLTKLPAVLLIPSLLLFAVISGKSTVEKLVQLGTIVAITVLGYGVFLTQALHPAFPQLFSRGGDFLFPISQFLSGGVLQQTLPSVPNYVSYFVQYATAPFLIFLALGLFYGKHKRWVHTLFWLGVVFLAPMLVLGKVVYPRYLLPAMLFFTPAVSLAIEGSIVVLRKKALQPVTIFFVVSVVLLCANIANLSAQFMLPALFQPNQIPFVSSDKEQYLLEWSSGHGILETVELVASAAQSKRIAVATEGYFGTLPDALLVYFFTRSVENISIDGIGQPVQEIPQEFLQKSQSADERWLVVNSHRLQLANPGTLLAEYCRPFGAPCLQVWRLNE